MLVLRIDTMFGPAPSALTHGYVVQVSYPVGIRILTTYATRNHRTLNNHVVGKVYSRPYYSGGYIHSDIVWCR